MIEFISTLILTNFPLLYFPHGLFFFAVGVGIIVQHRKRNPFRFAKDLWIMGVFALFHAFSEWFDVLIPFQADYFSSEIILILELASRYLESFSYLMLFIFGLRLLDTRQSLKSVLIPSGIFFIWCTIVGFFLYQKADPNVTLSYAQQFSHYLLLIPSCIVTAWALHKQGKEEGDLKLPPKVQSGVNALVIVFVFVGIFNGLFVNPGTFFPANIINSETFYNVAHFNVQWVRGLVGTTLMIVTLKLLFEFNKETDRVIAQAEEDALRFSERERIGQDLHDGVIQTLYATGMMLEATVRKLDPESHIQGNLNVCIKGLNRSILDLRHYITGLKNDDLSHQPLKNLLKKMLSEIQEAYKIEAEFQYTVNPLLKLSPNRQSHLYYVLTELLNNIGKHTTANQIRLKIAEGTAHLIITIWDNGNEKPPEDFWKKNIPPKGSGMGLRNMRERLMILRGELRYSYPDAGGNLMTLHIPKEVILNHDNSYTVS